MIAVILATSLMAHLGIYINWTLDYFPTVEYLGAYWLQLSLSITVSRLLIELFTCYWLYVGIAIYRNRYIVSHEYPTISAYFSRNTFGRYKKFIFMIIILIISFYIISVTAFGFIIWTSKHTYLDIYNSKDRAGAIVILVLYLIFFTVFLGIMAPIKLEHQHYCACCACCGCPTQQENGNTPKCRRYVELMHIFICEKLLRK